MPDDIITDSLPPPIVVSNSPTNFDSLTRGWWKFEQSLKDEFSTNDFKSDNSDQPTYTKFKQYSLLDRSVITKHGLTFDSDTSFSTDITSFIVSANHYSMNLGFWYYSPLALGFIKNVVTKEKTPVISPILAKSNVSKDNKEELVVDGQGEWIVSEIGFNDTQNAIQLAVCHNGSGPTNIFISEPYDIGLRNIYINLKTDGTSFYARIDIDGKFGKQYIRTDSSIKLINTSSKLRINDIGFGFLGHKAIQVNAYISNLMIQAKASTSSRKTIMFTRFGPEIALISDTEFPGFSFLGIGYEQPETINTNQIYSESGNIYVTRSNGDLLKGNRPIWDNEFVYPNQESLIELTSSTVGTKPEWTIQGLKLKGSTIKI